VIDRELQLLVERLEQRSGQPGDDTGDGELVEQIKKWNRAFFSGSSG
jgi:hypothetical protein